MFSQLAGISVVPQVCNDTCEHMGYQRAVQKSHVYEHTTHTCIYVPEIDVSRFF